MVTLIQEIRAMLYPSEKFALLRISFLTFYRKSIRTLRDWTCHADYRTIPDSRTV